MKVDTIIKAPHFFTMAGEGVGYRSGAALVVDRGRIVDLAEAAAVDGRYQAEETLALDHHAVLPGLIDAHMHLGLCIMRGLAQDVRNWMMEGIHPFEAVASRKDHELGARLAMMETIQAGTTTLGEWGGDLDGTCAEFARLGVRGNVTQIIREVERRAYGPGELYLFNPDLGRTYLQRNLELFDRWHGKADGRIRILFGPQAADFVGRELLLETRRLAKERNALIHMHVQQGDRETHQTLGRYGQRPIAWLKEIGYLDESLIAVHLTDADDQEAAVVARSGASMVACVSAITVIDGIVPPFPAFQAAGGRCGLGSDQAAGNNNHNMFNEMKLACLMGKVRQRDPEVMPCWRALRMATIEGAQAIGLGDLIGSLEVGKRADFIAVDLTRPTMLPVFTGPMRNIVPNLVYSARGGEVALSVVDGRTIMKDGRVLGLDQDQLVAELAVSAGELGGRAGEAFRKIHGPNAKFMEEGKL
jgi:5-methylthioadenosine/S-adenosylhomocysteine deaminase